jgi:transcription-repair coupling factor (superfamily II helicase)
MLAEAVRSLKAGREPDLLAPLSATTEINLHAPALLPDAYCGDVHTRLSLYKRLATASKIEQIDAMLEEITDRFGKLPPQGQNLFDVHRLRVLAKPYGVTKIDAAPKLTVISFMSNAPVEAIRILELVQKNRHIKLAGNDKLRIERELAESRERAQMVRDVLRALGAPKAAENADAAAPRPKRVGRQHGRPWPRRRVPGAEANSAGRGSRRPKRGLTPTKPPPGCGAMPSRPPSR